MKVNLKDFEGTKSTKFIGDVIINHTLLNTQLKESLYSGQYIAKLFNNKWKKKHLTHPKTTTKKSNQFQAFLR